jgi:hypothetical protein
MVRERVLTIFTVLAVMALSGVALAGPRGTDKNYQLNEVSPSSRSKVRQAEPDWYRARAMQQGTAPSPIVPEATSGRYGCRYLYQGGPKSSFITC